MKVDCPYAVELWGRTTFMLTPVGGAPARDELRKERVRELLKGAGAI